MILDKEYYTPKEIAAFLGLTPDAIRAAIHAGTIKATVFNHGYVVTRDDLADYLKYRERRKNGV